MSAIPAVVPVFRRVCPSCLGTGRSGQDDGNGVYRSSGHCFSCGGSGTVEYTKKSQGETK